jgi:hypothetical protein
MVSLRSVFMDREGINSELLKIVSSPPAWVTALPVDEEGLPRYFVREHQAAVKSFLNATTDSVRLVRASYASRRLLAKYDLAELEDLRATVQVSELLREVSDESQGSSETT